VRRDAMLLAGVITITITACSSAPQGTGSPTVGSGSTAARLVTASQAACQSGLDAARSLNASLARHYAAAVASTAQAASGSLTASVNAPSGTVSDTVRSAAALEAGAITAIGEAARTIEYGNGEYPWSFISSHMAQLASAVQALSVACRPAPAAGEPLRSASPAACPSSAQLQAVWNTAPTNVRQSWTGLTVSGFTYISCWQGWIVANPIVNANGSVVFSRQDMLHLIPVTGLQQFSSAVCSSRIPRLAGEARQVLLSAILDPGALPLRRTIWSGKRQLRDIRQDKFGTGIARRPTIQGQRRTAGQGA
jgi:hypothetical protein